MSDDQRPSETNAWGPWKTVVVRVSAPASGWRSTLRPQPAVSLDDGAFTDITDLNLDRLNAGVVVSELRFETFRLEPCPNTTPGQ